jgi:hypothetical protein
MVFLYSFWKNSFACLEKSDLEFYSSILSVVCSYGFFLSRSMLQKYEMWYVLWINKLFRFIFGSAIYLDKAQ